MLRKARFLFALLLCGLINQPVLAATGDGQGGGGVRFGPYTLETGNETTGDLVVFGGPVTLEEKAYFDGDLTVFGAFESEIGAVVDGQLVVLGEAQVAGSVEGNVFVAGPIELEETAYIDGDLSVVGRVIQADGAVVAGDIIPINEEDWNFPIHIDRPVPVPGSPQSGSTRTPFWLRTLNAVARAFASVVILTLLGLVATSLWPQQIERVGRTIEEAALISFGTGFLTLVVAGLVIILLTITICLSPFAVIGLIVVSVGLLVGWISLGLVLGRRVLSGLFGDMQPKPVLAAVIGTGLLTLLMAMARIFGGLQAL
ncbi:MAG: polymer-forming cytoskeletal protein, partial [Anaerolineae bacterium]|nr:polymer-forming cytoskeletal protein [Anaerolineae bacterium]